MASQYRHRLFAFAGNTEDAPNTGRQSHFAAVGSNSLSSTERNAVARPASLRETVETGVVCVSLDFQRASDNVTSKAFLWQLGVDVSGEESGDNLSEHLVDVDVQLGARLRIAAPEFASKAGGIFGRHLAGGGQVRLVADQHQRDVLGAWNEESGN